MMPVVSTTAYINRPAGQKEGATMAATIINFEAEVRAFAAEFPTANVRRGVALCEDGTIAWADMYEVSRKALAEALVDADRDERARIARAEQRMGR